MDYWIELLYFIHLIHGGYYYFYKFNNTVHILRAIRRDIYLEKITFGRVLQFEGTSLMKLTPTGLEII